MKVTFKEEGHLYESFPARSWTSVTRLIERHTNEFDAPRQARISAQAPSSKWFGLDPEDIEAIWDRENKRSTDIGHIYHADMEQAAIEREYKKHRGKIIQVFPSLIENGIKVARNQHLEDGVYPEHIVYHEKIGAVGQIDLPMVANGFVDIDDYKTNKKIEMESFNGQMMKGPLSHLPDCNYWHYVIQLSTYMELILLKNKHLQPGKLQLKHVDFEIKKRDHYGFPVIQMVDGLPVVAAKTTYEIPFLREEAIELLKTLIK